MLDEQFELTPEYDQNLGFRYPEAERYLSGPVTETLYIIRQLYEAGILLKKYRDKAVACPSCLSPAISVKYLCVSCSNIEKRRILQHAACGFSDVEESFSHDGGFFCPKCTKPLAKSDLQDTAFNFTCRTCGESFEQPTWMHNCRKCKFNFTLNEASFIDVFSYVLSKDVRSELEDRTLSISPYRSQIESAGFTISNVNSLKGKSGTLQPFDLVARGKIRGKDSVIVLDMVSASGPLDVTPVSALMGKMIDTGVEVGVLVAIPGLDQAGRNLAELYDILVIESASTREAAEKFGQRLRFVVQGVQ
jgi:hypothetical protein